MPGIMRKVFCCQYVFKTVLQLQTSFHFILKKKGYQHEIYNRIEVFFIVQDPTGKFVFCMRVMFFHITFAHLEKPSSQCLHICNVVLF